MKVTFLGITCLLFDDGVNQILFDCNISRHKFFQAFYGYFEPNEPMARVLVDELKLDRLQAIFVSHSHFDHVLDVGNFANLTGAIVFGSTSTLNAVRSSNTKEEQLKLMKVDDVYQIGDFKITVLDAKHSRPKWYNDDLGKTIDEPFTYPVKKETFKEGGSHSFLIEHDGKKILIHPSFNCINGQYKDLRVDTLFFAIGNMLKEKKQRRNEILKEVIDTTKPTNLVPIHWDDFFKPMWKVRPMFTPFDNSKKTLKLMQKYCENLGIFYEIMFPLDTLDI